jgi:hypothetical protein
MPFGDALILFSLDVIRCIKRCQANDLVKRKRILELLQLTCFNVELEETQEILDFVFITAAKSDESKFMNIFFYFFTDVDLVKLNSVLQ